METRLTELYFSEVESGRLDFDRDPEYRDSLSRAGAFFPHGELPAPVFSLLDTANRISFVHGLRLGLRMARWALRP